MKIVAIKKILVPNLLNYIYLHCVRRLLWSVTYVATLIPVWPSNKFAVLDYLNPPLDYHNCAQFRLFCFSFICRFLSGNMFYLHSHLFQIDHLTYLLYLIRNSFVVILRLTCRFLCLCNLRKQRWIIKNSRRTFSIL